MDDPAGKMPAAVERAAEAALAEPGLLPQVWQMARAFWTSLQRAKLLLLGAGLVLVVGATAYMQIRLNAWNEPFYNAIEQRDLPEFLRQLLVFAAIAGVLLVLNVAQMWLNQQSKLKLREGLARDLFAEWLMPRRAFRLASAGEIGANPDQRLHEDTRHLTELTTDLGIGLLQATLLLASFIGVLWMLSANITLHVSGRGFMVPGYMVWCALIYAGVASWLSWLVGRPLIRLQAERYAREAELRFGLVRVNEHIGSVALAGGEADERRRLDADLDDVLRVMRRIVNALARLTWVTAGYGWFGLIAPILVAAPGYFGGDLSFGMLMMAVGAFIQVQQSLRWFIDNFDTIADWRATLLRVASFRQAVLTMDEVGRAANRIELVTAEDGRLGFENLEIATPTGCTMLRERHVAIEPGERVLIVGETGAGKTILFRAIAGLWPWGAGRIALPSDAPVAFLPRRAYVPPGVLRAALAYPAPETAYPDAALAAALERAGLARLAGALDRVARWDRELPDDDQQRLMFARLLLLKPRWVVIDEALDAMEPEMRARIIALLAEELGEAAIVNIGRPETRDGFFTRTLHLVKDPRGRRFRPEHRRPALAAVAE